MRRGDSPRATMTNRDYKELKRRMDRCKHKHRHDTLAQAQAHAAQLRDARVKPYYCSICKGYHVGHKPLANEQSPGVK